MESGVLVASAAVVSSVAAEEGAVAATAATVVEVELEMGGKSGGI
jgi:hypothetical protein